MKDLDSRHWVSYIIGTQGQERYINEIEKLKLIDTEMYCKEESVIYMAVYFGRSRGAIRARIKKLELEEKYGNGELDSN